MFNMTCHGVTERSIKTLCHLVCQVVMLVLVIMLSLPFFQPGMYNDDLSSSAQYGINVLYRRWRDDMSLYEPYANATAEAAYLSSKGREVYVDDFYLYAYYHSPFTQEDRERSSCQVVDLSFQLQLHHILDTDHIQSHILNYCSRLHCMPRFLRFSGIGGSSSSATTNTTTASNQNKMTKTPIVILVQCNMMQHQMARVRTFGTPDG